MKTFLFSFFAAAAVLLATAPLPAQQKTPELTPVQVAQYVEQKESEIEKWTKIKAPKGTDAYQKKDAAIKAVIDELFDHEFIARFVLGEKWEKTEPAKQDQFYQKLKQLLSDFYLDEIFYNKGYEKKYIDRGIEQNYIKGVEKSVFVTTELQMMLKNKPVMYEVIYHMYKPTGAQNFKMFDIELDGVSLIRNYRQQFTKSMKDSSIDDIIKKLENKLSKKNKDSKEVSKETPKK